MSNDNNKYKIKMIQQAIPIKIVNNGQTGQKKQMSLQELATSTLHQFSQYSPRPPLQKNKFQTYQKKHNRISTWHNDTEHRSTMHQSAYSKKDRVSQYSAHQYYYQTPTNMLLQLTKYLKMPKPIYYHKIKQKKNHSAYYLMQKQSLKKKQSRKGKYHCSTHVIPTPNGLNQEEILCEKPKFKINRGSAIKKIKSDLLSSFQIKHKEIQKEVYQQKEQSKKQPKYGSNRDKKVSSYYHSGMFKGSIIIKNKRRGKIDPQTCQFNDDILRKSLKIQRPSSNISQSKEFQLIQNLISLQKC